MTTEPIETTLFPETEINFSAPTADRQQATLDQMGLDLRTYFEARLPAHASAIITAAISKPAGEGRWVSLYYPALHSGDEIRDMLLKVIPASHFQDRRPVSGGNYVEELGVNVNGHTMVRTFYANDETLAKLAECVQQLALQLEAKRSR